MRSPRICLAIILIAWTMPAVVLSQNAYAVELVKNILPEKNRTTANCVIWRKRLSPRGTR